MRKQTSILLLAFAALLLGCSKPKFEKQFPTQKVTVNDSCSDRSETIKYSSMEEAEWKLLDFYLGNQKSDKENFIHFFDSDAFEQIIRSDNSSMNYPFDLLIEHLLNARIVDSKDGFVRFYGWEASQYDLHSLVQYRKGDKVFCFEPEISGSFVDTLHYIYGKEALYYMPISYSYINFAGGVMVNAYEMTEEGLIPSNIFETKDGMVDGMWFEAEEMTCGCHFDETDMILYTPLIKNGNCTSKYIRYIWNGKHFVKVVGEVMNKEGERVYLTENYEDGLCSIKASTKVDGLLVGTKVFKVGDEYVSEIPSVKDANWYSSDPEEGFFAFNYEDKSLYLPFINKNLNGHDYYLVYKFDGEHFVYDHSGGGFWLHPSLRNFFELTAIGQTSDYLVRIDKLGKEYRYAAWKHKDAMCDKPDLIINGGSAIKCGYEFQNRGYRYVFDENDEELRVYHGDKLVLHQFMEIW